MAVIPGVSDGELIRTTWGDAVADELNNETIKRNGATAMTGDLTLRNVDPTATNHAARKFYVDNVTNNLNSVMTENRSNRVAVNWGTGVNSWFLGESALAFEIDGTAVFAVSSTGKIYHSFTGPGGSVKTFVIDHPLDADRHLIHACLEGPTADVFYRGRATIVDDSVTVDLPDYFEALTVPDTATVMATAIGQPATLGVDGPTGNTFTVNGPPCDVHWQVTAQRVDADFDIAPLRTDIRVLNAGPYAWFEPAPVPPT